MNYDGELKLLTETFRKCRIPVALVQSDQPLTSFLDSSLHLLFEKSLIFSTQQFLARIKPFTVYRLSGAFGFCFLFFCSCPTPPSKPHCSSVLICPIPFRNSNCTRSAKSITFRPIVFLC